MIVDEPDAARPLPGAPEVLARLADRYARVWVVSGRPASFLQRFLGDTGVRLSGLYGLEWVDDGRVVTHPSAERWRPVVEDVARSTESQGPAGLLVERKGLSVTLHYRVDPDLERDVRRWADEEATRT